MLKRKIIKLMAQLKLRRMRRKSLASLLRLKLFLKSIGLFLQKENFIQLLNIILCIIIFSTIGLYLVEENLSLFDSFWWTIVTLTTVGYGDITPVTFIGKIIAIIDMFLGIGVLAIMSANIASILVDKKIKEDLGMNSYNFQDHIIICEWNYRSRIILKELRHEDKTKEKPIILIAEIDRKPVEDAHLFFVKGEITDEVLTRANLAKASTVIILGDENLDYRNRDAKVILNTLTVESINPNVYTIVELVDETYIPTCKRAHADEIIVSSNVNSKLISNAAINHGVSNIVTDILSYEYGSQLYKVIVSESHIGWTFMELLVYMKEVNNSIIIGIQNGEFGEIVSNPDSNYILQNNDYLILIAACQNHHSVVK